MERTTDRKNHITPVVWKLKCYQCDCDFNSYSWNYDDPPMEWCCSEECYKEYDSKENRRDRKIKSILNEI
jgi:hypothetical protein